MKVEPEGADLGRREDLVPHSVHVPDQVDLHGMIARPHLLRHAVYRLQHLLR